MIIQFTGCLTTPVPVSAVTSRQQKAASLSFPSGPPYMAHGGIQLIWVTTGVSLNIAIVGKVCVDPTRKYFIIIIRISNTLFCYSISFHSFSSVRQFNFIELQKQN